MGYWEQRELFDKIHSIFKSVLGNATPDEIFKRPELTIAGDKKRLREYTSSKVLSHAIYEVDFPRVAGPVDLYHYTSIDGFKGIISGQQLYLFPVIKRWDENEFEPFTREHNLDGYFTPDPKTGVSRGEELSEDLYYISLTDLMNVIDDEYLWDVFTDEGKGVRLKLRVTPKQPSDLRRIGYQTTNGKTALSRINELLGEIGMSFHPWEISRIPAFYLPEGLKLEDETRLMIKKHIEGEDRTIQFGKWKVWPVPLAAPGEITKDPWCEIELLEIKCGPECNRDDVLEVLKGTKYQDVPVA